MVLTLYDIIISPIMTSKTSLSATDVLKKITLKVHPAANKRQVKEALEKLFNVEVKAVNIDVRKGKKRRLNRVKFQSSLTKRAIVTFMDKKSLDAVVQGAGAAMQTIPSASSDKSGAK
jgi:large subunit ribosomal protein L23